MRFGISTLKRTICALLVGAFLLIGLAVPAEAQRRGSDGRWWDGRNDNGRHRGWTRGRHRGWDNNNQWRRRALRRQRREWRDDRREWRDDRRDWRRSRRQWRRTNWSRNRVNFIGPPVRVWNRR